MIWCPLTSARWATSAAGRLRLISLNAYLMVQEMLRLVRDLVSPDLCKVGNLCSLEAEADISNAVPLVSLCSTCQREKV